ncbi:copper binding plastocyanin/azurin family protein [Solirubrobacter pauli]|uniref:Copper binding plastocyanin/azurin family protein n=1 Tax=Solirubrobacter pauli TaxID=166793 RepID=A0A660L2X4_9ACTN|nr:plastocyanin/azurin family copper-binding protein [Solirubrobacter pauli]RKQ87269.1 copper binding plastocyanin/azurin family protein [Solirubrobacter pauli]
MTWLAILLSIAGFGGPTMEVKPRKCAAQTSIGAAAYTSAAAKTCVKKKRKTPAKPQPTKPGADTPTTNPAPRTEPGGGTTPEATPTPKPGATPVPTATPVATPTPVTYPTRTNVDLTDTATWSVRPSYRILAAGKIDFNVNNRGEDDHNLTVRNAAARDLGTIDLAPGNTGTLTVDLGVGTYTLYCSLPQHEEAGMKATISVR